MLLLLHPLQAKDLMNAMLTSRKEADQLAKQHGIRQQPPAGAAAAAAGDSEAGGAAAAEEGSGVIPDSVIMKMLAREALLTVRRGHIRAPDTPARNGAKSLKC